jgi:Tol biopolymer transport system component
MTIVPDTTVQLSLVSISPDGAQVSIARNQVIEAIDLTTGKTMRISIRPSEYPAWSPDGKRIAYVSQGDSSLYVRSADGTGPEERYSQQIGSPLMWPSDDFLTIQVRQDTMALTVDSKRQLVPILSLTNVRAPRFSRDGRLVAYTTADGDVYVRPFNLARAEQWTEPPIKISTQRAAPEFNRWRADGRETYYLSADGWIMAVEITTTPALKAGLPRPLFRVPAGFDMNGLVGANSDASPDGQRFVFLVSQ